VEDFPIGARVAFGAVAGTDRKAWTWSGEGKVVSHNLPLKFMKFATSEGALTTSHILLSNIKESASIDQPSTAAQRKIKKGILVNSETGTCLNNSPQSLDTF